MSNVIEVEFPRKPAARVVRTKTYRCTDCGHQVTFPWRVSHAVYCEYGYGRIGNCGAEMRPVEMEAK